MLKLKSKNSVAEPAPGLPIIAIIIYTVHSTYVHTVENSFLLHSTYAERIGNLK